MPEGFRSSMSPGGTARTVIREGGKADAASKAYQQRYGAKPNVGDFLAGTDVMAPAMVRQEQLMGDQQRPTAQEMNGGIPQNADPGKRQLFGDFTPPPVTAAPQMDMSAAPAQLKPQQAPIAPVASPPAQMGPVGGPPMGAGMPMGGGGMVPPGAMNQLGDYASQPPPNPTMQQALMERLKQLQAGGR